ncbi:hypothetical protein BDZ89DRAFT_1071558 [Hymenopellis radicata]|nr:hypothetical protein BDZ89DRAFT_1071558 [Hymenopellis radicata]
MGQSASRQQVLTPPSPATASTVSTSNNEIVSEDSVDNIPEPVSRPRRRSARSSVRRSILNLVKPRSSQQQQPRSEEPKPANSRKSWRTSKRWSKAPPALVPDDLPLPSTSRLSPPPSITEKEPEPPLASIDVDVGEPSQSTPEPERPQEIPYSPDIGQWFNDDDSPDERVVISPDTFALPQDHLPDVPEDVSPPPTINHPDQPAVLPQPPSRGVVHTTDVPRPPLAEPLQDVPEPVSLPSRGASVPPRSSTPASLNTERPGARNRLSALLRSRPSSMVSSAEAVPEPVSETATPRRNGGQYYPTHSIGSISSSSIDVLASLLTGSSEPILSSGLTPPTPTGSAPPLNDQNIRPMSPTPTSGSSDAGGRTERMRQAWASIRERLGIRPPRSSDRTDDRAEAGDARERMLAEMARAFNLGLGINSPSTDGSTPADSSEPALPLPQLPAEGTFERFLIDLQLDLRATLTQRQDEAENEAPHQPELSEIVPSSDWDPIPVPTTAPVTSPPPLIHDVPAEEDENMPELEDVSDSDSDSHFSSDSVSVHNDESTTPSSSVHASPLQTSTAQAPELPPRPIDRINWWRLYRFPAIAAPRGGSSFDVNLRPPTATPAPATENASIFTLDSSSPSDLSTPPSDPWLQSVHVNMDWRAPPGEQEGDVPHEDDGPLPDLVREPRPDTPRGRRWHSRRRARRRSEVAGHPAELDPTGSRTFLVYPNNLDSFEALLDLAEILGQVKPPTASKEEIEKSNLEVIKAARVAEYEQIGKISSNCTERCLICLDDYAEDDEVRVMVCRHAFHKGCVDMWLQTGKNNCPACRGAGVSTDESSIPPTH